MQRVLQIVFNLSPNNSENSNTHTFWDLSKDFIVPIGIALIAAYIAYLIFVKETKRDKENEKRKKKEESTDKLLFFSTIIESCLSVSIQQKNNIKEYIRLITKNDVDFHLMTFVPLNDLKRVSTVLNLEDYLLAYVNKYPLHRKKTIKEFKEILASIDFLLEIYTQIPEQLQKAQMYDYERKIKMQGIFENAYNLTGKLTMSFEHDSPANFQKLIKLYENFSNNHPGDNYNITFYYTHFFIPYNDFCTNYLANGEPPFQVLLDLALLTRDGKQLYGHIKAEHQILKQQLINDFKIIYGALLDLRVNGKNLMSEI